jgi:hypothetical protein
MTFGKKLPIIFSLLFVFPGLLFSQPDHVGSGRAVELDGVDDYVDLGNIYDDAKLPVTLSAWVKIDPAMPTQIAPVFVSQDNSPLYNGFWLGVSANTVFVEYGDGFGQNNPAFRRGKSANVSVANGQWVHVCGVIRAEFDISIYVNGVDMGGSPTGESDLPMSSNFPADVAKAGYLFTNGVTHHFKGSMDDLRVWNRSLSATEVRDGMCKKLTGKESGLVGYWTFDETSGNTVVDTSTKGFNGTLAGNPKHIYSGAPIGDVSAYLYPASWTSTTVVSLTDGADKIDVNNVTGNPPGVQVYAVNDVPSQTGGLTPGTYDKPYLGVFAASLNNSITFDTKLYRDGTAMCSARQRSDNSVPTWSNQSLAGILLRTEIIGLPCCVALDVDLGPDRELCDKGAYTLEAPAQFSGMDLLWSTGATTPSIIVNTTGNYWLKVGDCAKSRDTVSVRYVQKPPIFSLGDDEVICVITPRKLRPLNDPQGFQFAWQNGSTDSTFTVREYGEYWVNVSNACGTSSDKITFSKLPFDKDKIPNVITPGNDELNETFIVEESLLGSRFTVFNRWGESVYDNFHYQNNWSGSGLPSGVYYYVLRADCVGQVKGSVSLIKGE